MAAWRSLEAEAGMWEQMVEQRQRGMTSRLRRLNLRAVETRLGEARRKLADAREKHDWFLPHENGYPNLGPWESCRKCGVVKNDRNADAETCRGVVKVELR